MAFCTKCGSTVAGAFCAQCGTPSAAGPPAPPKRKTSPMVWVLVVVLALFCVSIVGVIGTGAYVAHRLKRAGVDAELLRRDPQRAIARLVEMHPDFEFVGTDGDTITIRNRRTGQRFSLSFDNARRGKFSLEAIDGEGRGGAVQVGGEAKIPSWVPEYPGSPPEPLFSARGESEEGAGEAGSFRFETPDSPARVVAFYEEKARGMGLTVHTVRAHDSITLTTADEERDRVLKVVADGEGSRTSVLVTYGRKR